METLSDDYNVFINSDIIYDEVAFAVKQLKFNKATGFDGIPNEVLKHNSIIYILFKLFQFCFNQQMVPLVWLKWLITPIPKGTRKDPCMPLNYRGVTLLSCISKTYTFILKKRITNYLETNNILVEEQSGFRKNRSCSDNLFALSSIIRNENLTGKHMYLLPF